MADLGEKYRDTVTGYAGTATARTEFLHDSPSIRLTSIGKDGRPEDVWLTEGRLEPVDGKSLGFSGGFHSLDGVARGGDGVGGLAVD